MKSQSFRDGRLNLYQVLGHSASSSRALADQWDRRPLGWFSGIHLRHLTQGRTQMRSMLSFARSGEQGVSRILPDDSTDQAMSHVQTAIFGPNKLQINLFIGARLNPALGTRKPIVGWRLLRA